MLGIQAKKAMPLFCAFSALHLLFSTSDIKNNFKSFPCGLVNIDVAHGRSSKTNLPAYRFLLCMSSEVLHKMICRPFSESMAPRLELERVDGGIYSDVLDLRCGKECL